jgi:GTPase SAR1 family protein
MELFTLVQLEILIFKEAASPSIESGKTSTLNSLKNTESNNCERIGVDDRTIGIDICDFLPDPQMPLKFFAWDFAGQGVYAMMQQLFMSKRAIYPLLWRVR